MIALSLAIVAIIGIAAFVARERESRKAREAAAEDAAKAQKNAVWDAMWDAAKRWTK
jgi:Na+-transporting methylmalonyl-CoA/oxaloacetate decarboxylase gamma subunit